MSLVRRPLTFAQSGYKTIATAGSFEELAQQVADMELPKGTRVKFKMKLSAPVAPAFDGWGAEKLFPVPQGMEMVDVWGEGSSTAYVELEADPAWLAAVLGFIAANWAAIIISSLVLSAIILNVTLLIKIIGVIPGGNELLLLLVVAALAFGWMKTKKGRKEPQRE